VNGIPDGYPVSGLNYGRDTGVSLEQNVGGLTPGNVYVLEFWTGGEQGFYGDGIFAVDIGFGKTYLRNPSTAIGDIGRRFIIQFLANAAAHKIKFTNWGHISIGSTELLLDDVRLYPVSQLSSIIPACAVGINAAGHFSSVNLHMNEQIHRLEVDLLSAGNYILTIYNPLGQQLIRTAFSKDINIGTESLQKGIYICSVTGTGIKYTDKIIIH
jgi:hypothetical protein